MYHLHTIRHAQVWVANVPYEPTKAELKVWVKSLVEQLYFLEGELVNLELADYTYPYDLNDKYMKDLIINVHPRTRIPAGKDATVKAQVDILWS